VFPANGLGGLKTLVIAAHSIEPIGDTNYLAPDLLKAEWERRAG